MLVGEKMTKPVVTLLATAPFQDGLKLMREYKIRRIPIVDGQQRLIGIVSERDLLHAAPSPATSLSIWEMNYLLWKLTVGDVMTKKVFTVRAETPLQDAAQLMLDHKIGGLPVVDATQHVVGVITETDIFKAFVALLSSERLAYA